MDSPFGGASLRPPTRALFVDDWPAAGAPAITCQQLTEDASAQWVGVAVMADALQTPQIAASSTVKRRPR